MMCKSVRPRIVDKENRHEYIVMLYNWAIEELDQRRKLEWQTLIIVNIVYGFVLKILNDYKEPLEPFAVGMIIIAATLFTYIWLVRVHINSWRMERPWYLRDKIREMLRGCKDKRIHELLEGHRQIREPNQGEKWPFYGHRGVMAIICLYYCVLVVGVLYQAGHTATAKWLAIALICLIGPLSWLDITRAKYRRTKREEHLSPLERP